MDTNIHKLKIILFITSHITSYENITPSLIPSHQREGEIYLPLWERFGEGISAGSYAGSIVLD